ncbi:hypothetical protein DAI22_04g057833 [Oryza sativa Japonica Group]|nr:hypothetical protein DAI22_04g057833 [Oryza sativa Japonica Group]
MYELMMTKHHCMGSMAAARPWLSWPERVPRGCSGVPVHISIALARPGAGRKMTNPVRIWWWRGFRFAQATMMAYRVPSSSSDREAAVAHLSVAGVCCSVSACISSEDRRRAQNRWPSASLF